MVIPTLGWLILENIAILICMGFLIWYTENQWWWLMLLMLNKWSAKDLLNGS